MPTNLNFSFLFLLSACGDWRTIRYEVWALQDSRKAEELKAPGTSNACRKGRRAAGWGGEQGWLKVFRPSWGQKWGASRKTGVFSEMWQMNKPLPPAPLPCLATPGLRLPGLRGLRRDWPIPLWGNWPPQPGHSLRAYQSPRPTNQIFLNRKITKKHQTL